MPPPPRAPLWIRHCDTAVTTLCIACTAESDVFECRRSRSLRIGMMRLEAEESKDQTDREALFVHVPFDRGRSFAFVCISLHFYFFFFNLMLFLDFQMYFFLPFLIFLILAFHFCLIFAETWGHVFRREGVVWEGTLPEYTLWQTAHMQLIPGRLSIADLSESLVRVRVGVRVGVSVGGELQWLEECEWRVGRDWMERQLRELLWRVSVKLFQVSHRIRPVGSG